MSNKRTLTLESFLTQPPAKRPRNQDERPEPSNDQLEETAERQTSKVGNSHHPTYPFPIPNLPEEINNQLDFTPSTEGRTINNQPDLDLIYYQPYMPSPTAKALFVFLRSHLPFYRVQYNIKRGPTPTQINTPRWTTVFGVDETARFNTSGYLQDASTGNLLPPSTYACKPRPLPACLDRLRVLTENATGQTFNFALVNYYSSGQDSISYHSDDERFLGPEPTIASFTLGATRDFLLRHKKVPPSASNPVSSATTAESLKLPLASGDMILMRGRTQAHWEHSIPKRKGPEAERGRINITFRRAMVKGGTANYYRYNVGDGPVYQWDEGRREMVVWKSVGEG